jgi:uncharacterized protein (TIGR02147 family)
MSAFQHQDYKNVLREKIHENQGVSGYKGKLAEAAGCQRAYLSQVLSSHVQLTPDHAAGLALFWGLSALERDYFMELVNHARAATPALRRLIESRLEVMKDKQNSVSGRIGKPRIESIQLQSQYYSSWHYSAIHILITIAKYRTPSAIAERLSLSEDIVAAALTVLEQMGLAKRAKGGWIPVSFDLHLPKNSPLTNVNHMNWRTRAVQNAQRDGTDAVHFTAVYSLSEKDFQLLRTRMLQFISETRDVALSSSEEDLVSFTCDYFRV